MISKLVRRYNWLDPVSLDNKQSASTRKMMSGKPMVQNRSYMNQTSCVRSVCLTRCTCIEAGAEYHIRNLTSS